MLARAEELAIHVPGALNHGVTREEIEEVMVQLTVYGGFPRAVEGIRSARAAFERIDARDAGRPHARSPTNISTRGKKKKMTLFIPSLGLCIKKIPISIV